MFRPGKTLSTVQFRFWALLLVILTIAVISSAVALKYTATPFLLAQQNRMISQSALQEARSFEAVLARYRLLMNYIASDPDVINVVMGYVENSDVVEDNLEILVRPNALSWVALYDAFGEIVADMRFRGEAGDVFNTEDIASVVTTVTEADESSGWEVGFKMEGDLAYLLIAVPVVRRGFVEGVLTAGFRISPQQVFAESVLAEKTVITTLGDLPEVLARKPIESQSVRLAGTDLAIVLVPNLNAVEAAGRRLVTRAVSAVAMVLVAAFALFALLGRAALVQPHKALEQQKKSLSELAAVAERANDAITVTDLEGRVTWTNPASEELTGYSSEDMRGKRPGRMLQGVDTDPASVIALRKAIAAREAIVVELLNYRRNGSTYWVSLSITPLENDAGQPYGFVAISNDVTERRAQQDAMLAAKAEIERQALHDPLTGLPNRRSLDLALQERATSEDASATIVRIDLDHFKYVNDTMGHEAGDFVLCEVADILREETKKGDLPVRVGGDEFVILLEAGQGASEGRIVAERMLERIKQPRLFADKTIRVGASFGVASTLDNLLPIDELIVGADAALYEAKDLGRNMVRNYTEQLHTYVLGRRSLARELRRAVAREEFIPYFQPQVDAETYDIVGVETLVRWSSPELGLLMPDEFLPIAEQLSAVDDIDGIVFNKAIREVSDLLAADLRIPKVSFNVTAERIQSSAFFEALSQKPENAPKIAFEILESVLVEEQSDLFAFSIERLRSMGATIEIDDFGSGHASIVGLMHLSPDVMKIDKQLILPIVESAMTRGLLRQIIGMANLMGLRVTAEGVETLEHAKILRQFGCHTLQGYLISKPMPQQELGAFVERWQRLGPEERTATLKRAS